MGFQVRQCPAQIYLCFSSFAAYYPQHHPKVNPSSLMEKKFEIRGGSEMVFQTLWFCFHSTYWQRSPFKTTEIIGPDKICFACMPINENPEELRISINPWEKGWMNSQFIQEVREVRSDLHKWLLCYFLFADEIKCGVAQMHVFLFHMASCLDFTSPLKKWSWKGL